MKRVALIATLLALAGCNFAVKHPAATAGIVAGSLAFVTCELAAAEPGEIDDHKTCAIAGGAVGLGLALIAAGALWLGTEDEVPAKEEPPPRIDWSKVPDTTPKEPTKAPQPPPTPPPDAGVPLEPAGETDAGAAPVDAQ